MLQFFDPQLEKELNSPTKADECLRPLKLRAIRKQRGQFPFYR